jgi:hypothetical protein
MDARAMHLFATTTAEQILELGKKAAFVESEPTETRRSGSAPARADAGLEPSHFEVPLETLTCPNLSIHPSTKSTRASG